MNIIKGQRKLISDFKNNFELEIVPIYEDLLSSDRNKRWNKVYTIQLRNNKKRKSQIKNKSSRTSSWIYIDSSSIAKSLNISAFKYNSMLKKYGVEYSRDIGLFFRDEDKCKAVIDKLYDYALYKHNFR